MNRSQYSHNLATLYAAALDKGNLPLALKVLQLQYALTQENKEAQKKKRHHQAMELAERLGTSLDSLSPEDLAKVCVLLEQHGEAILQRQTALP